MSANSPFRSVDLDSVFRRSGFVRGYQDVRLSRPFDYDLLDRADSKRFDYERGRQTAILMRQALGHVPVLEKNLEAIRPIYIAARLNRMICGQTGNLADHYADDFGHFSPERYASRHYAPTTSNDFNPLGF